MTETGRRKGPSPTEQREKGQSSFASSMIAPSTRLREMANRLVTTNGVHGRSELTEVTTAFRSYRVELIMRRREASVDASTSKACVSLRLAAATGATKLTSAVGDACVDGFEWERTIVSGGVLRLKTAQLHRLVVWAVAGSASVDVDQLKLVQVKEEE